MEHSKTSKVAIYSNNPALLQDLINGVQPYGIELVSVSDNEMIIHDLKRIAPVLFILDADNSGQDYWLITSQIRKDALLKKLPVILILEAIQLEEPDIDDKLLRVNDYLIKPIDPRVLAKRIQFTLNRRDSLLKQEKNFFETLGIIGNLAEQRQVANDKLAHQMQMREDTIINIMRTMTIALDSKDSYTAGHSERVATYSLKIGRMLGLEKNILDKLERGAILHDIGKLIVEISYISKPGPLTNEEFEIMISHPSVGAKILHPLDFLDEELFIVKRHHESWDGSGYPEGLKGERIGLLPTIVTVADVFDALTSDRSYRSAWPKEMALEEIKKLSGIKFNPVVVEVLEKVIGLG